MLTSSGSFEHACQDPLTSLTRTSNLAVQAIRNPGTSRLLVKKLAPPLVTMLSAEAEIQYVALRNINLIVQRYPEILQNEIKVFFCKYNDPVFVKQEKLETMVKLSSEHNIEQVRFPRKSYQWDDTKTLNSQEFLAHLATDFIGIERVRHRS